jgi:N-acetylmuramoyl-L-alanine amidase
MAYKPLVPEQVAYLVIHCAATPSSMDIGVEEIRRWHRESGWFDIGYHYVIRRDGTIETGRDTETPGAHARGFNDKSIGICLVGGTKADGKTPEDNFTVAQYNALRKLLPELMIQFPWATILGHRDLPNVNKACPSFDVQEWWANEIEWNRGDSDENDTGSESP